MNNNKKKIEDNKYYSLFISGEVSEDILNEKMKDKSFEDHFWHLACLSAWYQKQGNKYLEKMILRTLCDLNYAYSAMYYFKKMDVLPIKYNKYLDPFVHPMNEELIEDRIAFFNKDDTKKQRKSFLLYSLSTLVVIPIMLLLVLVFKLDSTLSIVLSIVAMFSMQFLLNPMLKQRRMMKENSSGVERRLSEYLKYYDRFALLFQNDDYIALIKEKNEDKIKEIVKRIKAGDKQDE